MKAVFSPRQSPFCDQGTGWLQLGTFSLKELCGGGQDSGMWQARAGSHLSCSRGLGYDQHVVRDNIVLVGVLPGRWDYQQPSWKKCPCGHKQPAANGPQDCGSSHTMQVVGQRQDMPGGAGRMEVPSLMPCLSLLVLNLCESCQLKYLLMIFLGIHIII